MRCEHCRFFTPNYPTPGSAGGCDIKLPPTVPSLAVGGTTFTTPESGCDLGVLRTEADR